jgi:L-threonylcarbamoyladenylate synthase
MQSTDLSRIFDMANPAARAAGLEAAVAALRDGKLVAMPTETVYGLAADAANAAAVAGIFAAKGRPRFNPLIVHVASPADAEHIADFTPEARKLAAAFWPGPLTLVLPKRPGAPLADLVTAGLDTVAIRVPAHPVAHELLTRFGPLAAPSANRSGHVSPTRADHVASDLGDKVAVILDAGPTKVGLESTIVGFEEGKARMLRRGGIDRARIEAILGASMAVAKPSEPVSAPGMLASHYAPNAALRLDVISVEPGEALLAFGPNLPPGSPAPAMIRNLSKSGDVIEAATNLFAMLRDLDRSAKRIAVMPIPETGLGEAIVDRLRRAAAPHGSKP